MYIHKIQYQMKNNVKTDYTTCFLYIQSILLSFHSITLFYALSIKWWSNVKLMFTSSFFQLLYLAYLTGDLIFSLTGWRISHKQFTNYVGVRELKDRFAGMHFCTLIMAYFVRRATPPQLLINGIVWTTNYVALPDTFSSTNLV